MRVHVRRDTVVQDVGRNMAAAIDQHQRPLGAEAAKIEEVQARSAEEAGRVGLAERAAQSGKVIEGVADRGLAGFEELLAADRSDRKRRFKVRTTNARAGDLDRFAIGGTSGPGRQVIALSVGAGFDLLLAGHGLWRRLIGSRRLPKSRRCGERRKGD